jgi:hypothetical protein
MRILFAAFFLCFSSHVAAEEISSYGLLNKLSLSIRGLSPSMDDYRDLQKSIAENTVDQFFHQKRMQYLDSSFHVEKMRSRLNELFNFKQIDTLFWPIPQSENYYSYGRTRENATDDLFVRIIAENKPWDTLLTEKTYTLHPQNNDPASGPRHESSFFAGLSPNLKSNSGHLTSLETETERMTLSFHEDDPRVGGVITSPRFLDRYVTTGLNKNRKRAAAIFDIFMCDPMAAAVPDQESNKGEIKEIQFPDTAQITEEEMRRVFSKSDKIHGNQADCRSCHYKLDPMGQTLRGSLRYPSPIPWPGRLTFKNSNGNLVDIPVRGIGDLGKAVTQQPEYVQCQVRYFWNWFIGKDIILTPARHKDLVEKFEDVGRKPNDFIYWLTTQPEFKENRVVNPTAQLAISVRRIFKRCQSCHVNKTDDVFGELVDLTKWPLGHEHAIKDPKHWLSEVENKLDLQNGGARASMPPKSSNWTLTYAEKDLIKKWIDLGGPDEEGKKQEEQ